MISTEKDLKLAGIANDSIVDGPGLRITFFFQGCRHACAGCHNPTSWPLTGGEETDAESLLAKIDANPLLQGVTFSGGEPLLRAEALLPLAEGIRARRLPLAIYTGYTFEEILADDDPAVLELLTYADTLIDGPFVLAQKSLTLPFRGSRGQRILDMAASLKAAAAVPQTDPAWGYSPEE